MHSDGERADSRALSVGPIWVLGTSQAEPTSEPGSSLTTWWCGGPCTEDQVCQTCQGGLSLKSSAYRNEMEAAACL